MATTYTPNYHLGKQEDRSDKFAMKIITDNMDIIDEQLKATDDKATAAAAGLKYKGAVNYYNDLPNDAELGDAYTVLYAGSSGTVPDGTEYVWGELNGTAQWIDFSKNTYTKAEVDALLAAKQALLNADNKLDPAYINYDITHRAVSDAEKSTWNGKQNALNSAQLAAANSGVTAERLTADESNISTLAYINPMAIYSLSIKKMVGTGMVIPEGTQVDMNTGNYVLRFVSDTARNGTLVIYNGATETYRASIDIVSGTNIHRIALNSASDSIKFAISASATITDLTLISAAYYDSGRTGYVEKSLPNAVITSELIDLVDSGAKNLCNNTLATGTISSNVTATVSIDKQATLSGTTPSNADASFTISTNAQFPAGTYIGSGCPSGGANDKYRIDYVVNDSTVYRDTGNGVEFTLNSASNVRSQIVVYRGNAAPSAAFKPMLCTKAAWDVSQKFVPYRPTYEETVEQVAIVDITSNVTAESGYTVDDTSHLYRQGKHIFGTLIIKKASGNFSNASQETIATIGTYAPEYQYLGISGFTNTVWAVQNIGYVFVQKVGTTGAGSITVMDTATTNNCVKIPIDYVTA